MTLTEIRSRVRALVQDSAGTYVTDGMVDDWVNEAYLDIVSRERILTTEASGTMGTGNNSVANGTIDIPSDFIAIISLRFSEDDAEFVNDDVFWSHEDAGSDLDHTIFSIFNDKIYLYPKPTSGTTYKIRHVKKPTEMSTGADVPSLPDNLQPKLVYYAVYRARLFEGDTGGADRYRADYEHNLTQASYRNRVQPGPFSVSFSLDGPFDQDGIHN